jgi:flagellar hook-associated protein FlgK
MTQLETVMGDDDANLSGGIDRFFAALNAVAGVDPTSTPLRQQVVTAAGLLAQRFNSLNNVYNAQLQSVQPAAHRDRRLGQHAHRHDRRAEHPHRPRTPPAATLRR